MKNKHKIIKDLTKSMKALKALRSPYFKNFITGHTIAINNLVGSKVPVLRVNERTLVEQSESVPKILASGAYEVVPPYEKFWIELVQPDGKAQLMLIRTERIDGTNDFTWSLLVIQPTTDTNAYQLLYHQFYDYTIDAEGEVKGILKPMVAEDLLDELDPKSAREVAQDMHDHSESVQHASLLTTILCNFIMAKNIITVTETEDGVVARKGKKNKLKKTKLPYITIAVKLSNKQRERFGLTKPYITFEDMDRMSISQRRGGLRDYTKGNGLFGKYHGVYYWNPILMGGKSKTSVVKTA